jgi:hypothetical protein
VARWVDVRTTVPELLAWLRRTWSAQVLLQQRYLDRHDVTGAEARAALRELRWSGSVLVGDLLPPAGGQRRRL